PGEGQGRNESIVEEARDPDVRVEVFEGAALEPDGRVAVEAAGRGDVDAQRIEEAAGRERNLVSIRAPPGSRWTASTPLTAPVAVTPSSTHTPRGGGIEPLPVKVTRWIADAPRARPRAGQGDGATLDEGHSRRPPPGRRTSGPSRPAPLHVLARHGRGRLALPRRAVFAGEGAHAAVRHDVHALRGALDVPVMTEAAVLPHALGGRQASAQITLDARGPLAKLGTEGEAVAEVRDERRRHQEREGELERAREPPRPHRDGAEVRAAQQQRRQRDRKST